MKIIRYAIAILATIVLLLVGYGFYVDRVGNPRVARELVDNPDGERARRVMLLTLPSGRQIPVNFMREEAMVYAAADGSWWKELQGDSVPVGLFLRGKEWRGSARAILDDPQRTASVFQRLRPNAIEGFGVLIEIRLDEGRSL